MSRASAQGGSGSTRRALAVMTVAGVGAASATALSFPVEEGSAGVLVAVLLVVSFAVTLATVCAAVPVNCCWQVPGVVAIVSTVTFSLLARASEGGDQGLWPIGAILVFTGVLGLGLLVTYGLSALRRRR